VERDLFASEHDLFRAAFRRFVEDEIVPHHSTWERDGIVDRALFARAGSHGYLAMAAPTEHGGGGEPDFRFNVVVGEELQRAGVYGSGLGLALHNDVCLPYFLHFADEAQQARWLPGICAGSSITALAMTEPGAGSDVASLTTTAVRDGNDYVVNGSKTFITNGINADLIIVAVRTDTGDRHGGLSLLVLERGMEGLERGRNLDKVGLHAQDTAELFFRNVRVPNANRLGPEGAGFRSLMVNLAQERLSLAVAAVAGSRACLDATVAYVKERVAFGRPVASFQNTRFRLAELHTEVAMAQTFVDTCVRAHNARKLSPAEAAMAKWWTSELHGRAADLGVQLHGGYGYMTEYPIARAYADARVSRIYGGTTEIMKEIVGRDLGL